MDFNSVSKKVISLIGIWEHKLLELPENVLIHRRNSQNRNIKQIIGHLIDSASNNHQRMVRLHYTRQLKFPDYRQDNDRWISIQNPQDENWYNLVNLWKYFNLHLAHIIAGADLQNESNYWHDYEGRKVTLGQMVEGYYAHLLLHMNEIQELTDDIPAQQNHPGS